MREIVKLRCPHCDRALTSVSSAKASTPGPVHVYRKCGKRGCGRRWLFTRMTQFGRWTATETFDSIRSRQAQEPPR
jgi:hypothetical protein